MGTEESLTPFQQGFRMPAEWDRHFGTWLAWPTNPLTWPDRLEQVEAAYWQMIEALAIDEKVLLLVDDEETRERLEHGLCVRSIPRESVHFFLIPTIDAWIRDYGPNFVVRGASQGRELAFNHWGFNAWGGKYEDLKQDHAIPGRIGPLLGIPSFEPGIVLEGGSIEVNGSGLCLTTEQCLLNSNRNPHLSRKEIERYLRDFLGAESVLWLGDGIEGDDTDGHIDDIARFVSAETVVCAVEKDPADPNYGPLLDNLARLRDHSLCGRPLQVIPVPMPEPIHTAEGRLPASYMNFLIANQVLLLPVFNQPGDREAVRLFTELFPHHRVKPIPCEDLLLGMGAVHCLTQQQPWGPTLLDTSTSGNG